MSDFGKAPAGSRRSPPTPTRRWSRSPIGGKLFAGGLLSGRARPLDVEGPVFDPRPDPTARRVAYVSGSTLRIGELDGRSRVLVGDGPDDGPHVSWGVPDFVAAEEMHRYRGYWWSPDGEHLAVCRVDESPVTEWTIADPASPSTPARTVRYPAAGTDNAIVTLHLVNLDGAQVAVDWDREFFPYVATVEWTDAGLLMSVVSRDQRGSMTLRVDTATGETEVVAHDYDDAWVELVPGLPRLLDDGRLVTANDHDGSRRLQVDGESVTPADIQVRSVIASTDGAIYFQANPIDDATELHVWRWTDDELTAITIRARRPHRRGRRADDRRPLRDARRARRADRHLDRVSGSRRSPSDRSSRRTSRSSRPAKRASPPPSCCRTTTTARHCPSCSIRTAGRTRCASSGRRTPSRQHNGSPTRVSPSSLPMDEEHLDADRHGNVPSISIWPRRPSTTRSPRCTPPPSASVA